MLFAVGALALPTHNAGALALTACCLTAVCVASATSAQPPPSELMPSGSLSEQISFFQGSLGSPLQPGNKNPEALPRLNIRSHNDCGDLPLSPGIEESDRDRSPGLNFSAPASESASFQAVSRLKKFHRLPSPSPLTVSNLPAPTGEWEVSALDTQIRAAGDRGAIAAAAGKPPSLRLLPETDYQAPPSISVGVPFAYGLSLGSVGIGLGLQERTRYTNSADGGMGISLGLGNPQKLVGFDVGISIFDLSDFASRGSVSFKLHRAIANDFEVALGWQNAIVWGSTDAGTSFYGVLTKTFLLGESVNQPFSLLVVSAGIGSGQFRSESDIYSDRETVGVFGSAALRVAKPLNAIAEWTGQDMTLGLSWVPFPKTPLVLTGGVTDLTGNAGDGSRLIFRVGYILSF